MEGGEEEDSKIRAGNFGAKLNKIDSNESFVERRLERFRVHDKKYYPVSDFDLWSFRHYKIFTTCSSRMCPLYFRTVHN